RVFVAPGLTVTGRLRQSPLPPSIVSVEYRRVTRARGSLSGAAAWSAATGPAALGQEAAGPQPLSVDVPIDTIDALIPFSQVWGVAAAPGVLAALVPDFDQTNLTPAQAATKLDALSQLETVQFVSS